MSQILVELVKLANLIININKSIACANRISSIFDIEEEKTGGGSETAHVNDLAAGQAPAVSFTHVSLAYEGAGDDSLSDIDFTAERGQTIGIIGGTGSGKTSLVNLIPHFYEATAGEVRVNGIRVQDYETSDLRERIGVVPQKAVLFRGSIRENMRWGKPDATDEEIMEALEVAQAKEIVLGKEGHLDYEIEQGGKNLSGGQRQRLTIARALVKKPEILILDDSASALDYATDAALRKALANRAGDTTTFIVSQRASSIRHADKIIVLDDGRMVGIGTHEELMKSCALYQEIVAVSYPQSTSGTGQGD
jgi:ABC-type multidrug transport system fused ATPase/permease subunit